MATLAQRSAQRVTSGGGRTIVAGRMSVSIPVWVTDRETFRRWVTSEAYPEKQRVCYLAGDVWVDISMEQFFSHNQVKQEVGRVLGQMVKDARQGRYVPDGMLLTNAAADLSCVPDGCFLSRESVRVGRVRLVRGTDPGAVELDGTPDMVLEVVSDSSVEKDTVTLPALYWRAGIPEYWLVDARGEQPSFTLLKHGAKGYKAARPQAGWLKSSVFDRSFRLIRGQDESGDPEFTLEVR